MRIGFTGLGIKGRPMAGHLQAAGHEPFLRDIGAPPEALIGAGAVACGSGCEVAERADVVIAMVPDTPHAEAALFGEGGVAEGLSPGKAVVDMSSVPPIATKGFARRVGEPGRDYLDAPVSGGEVGAEAASSTIMVRGPQAAFDRVRPLLGLMGRNATLVGGDGDGRAVKVANQIVVAPTTGAVAEALVFASKAGADPAKVRRAPMGGLAASRVLELHGGRMIERTFDPGFRVGLHRKDLNPALQGAKSLGVGLPSTATCRELFNACAANGGAAAWDHSGLVRALEITANHQVGAASKGAARQAS